MLVNVTVLSESKGPSSSWHRQLTTIPPTNQKHSNLRHAFKPPSAGSPQSFNHPTISSSADRVRPAPLLLAAFRKSDLSQCLRSLRLVEWEAGRQLWDDDAGFGRDEGFRCICCGRQCTHAPCKSPFKNGSYSARSNEHRVQ